jgi:hypothetical protein
MHVVKSWPKFFQAIRRGSRRHELRRNDRDYRVGDLLQLQEYEPVSEQYTGNSCVVRITSITSADEPCAVSAASLHFDYCILSIQLVDD